jgi:hypothetical protein
MNMGRISVERTSKIEKCPGFGPGLFKLLQIDLISVNKMIKQ